MHFYRISLFLVFYLLLFPRIVFAHHPGYVPLEGASGEEGIASGPLLNSPTASTLGRNRFSAGFTFDHTNFNAIPGENAHGLHEQGHDVHGKRHEEVYNIHIGYGVLEDLDLILILPIASKTSTQIEGIEEEFETEDGEEIHTHRGVGQQERSSGFGDLRLIGKYRFWKKYLEAALIAGIKFPTGKTSNKDSLGNKFEAEQQPGTGSWDGEFGVALSRSFKKRLSVASSFQYFLKGRGAQGRKLGDVFRYNVGGSVAVRKLGQFPNLILAVELNNEWALRDHSQEERRVLDSGGTTVFITPGVTAPIAKNLSAFWAMPIPIYQNLGGEHEELNYEMLTGVILSL